MAAATVKITAAAGYRTTAGTQARWSEIVPPLVTAPPKGSNGVSGLPFVSELNEWGPVERDRGNGEQSADDGRTITIGGAIFVRRREPHHSVGGNLTPMIMITIP
jgi:alpha-galactosidase